MEIEELNTKETIESLIKKEKKKRFSQTINSIINGGTCTLIATGISFLIFWIVGAITHPILGLIAAVYAWINIMNIIL